jgi:hypothetical protein
MKVDKEYRTDLFGKRYEGIKNIRIREDGDYWRNIKLYLEDNDFTLELYRLVPDFNKVAFRYHRMPSSPFIFNKKVDPLLFKLFLEFLIRLGKKNED